MKQETDAAMIEMTTLEYCRFKVRQEIARDALRDGIRLVDVRPKPKPRLITNKGRVVELKREERE